MKRISERLREKNIAEYLIYMWQVEDFIRANDCNIDKIKNHVISQLHTNEANSEELLGWYDDLIKMMYAENVFHTGHLQINNNVILELEELHGKLLGTSRYPYYHAAYYKALPFIAELRTKNKSDKSDIEVCFEAMYGILLLRLQKKVISKETDDAISAISAFLSKLADFYNKDKKNEIEF